MAKQKVAIIYGFGEGDYHGKAFVKALQAAGFEVVRDAKKADIVVTHSGGCFFLPPLHLGQTFILINPPYWPGKSLALSTVQKIAIDFVDFMKDGKVLQWFWKTAINIAHILRFIVKNMVIGIKAGRQRFYEALEDETSYIIRSDRDTFLAPNADALLEQKVGRVISMFTVAGQHDHCWRDPAPYVAIITGVTGKK